MKTLVELDKCQRGCAGEYLVCGELNKAGIIASLTIKNTKGIDILATNSDASKSVGIQVKSTIHDRGNYPYWILTEKSETYFSDTLFYVFVLLKEGNLRPEFHIVPSKKVAEHTKSTHKEWLEKRIKKGNTSKMRIFYDQDNQFLERWDLLGL